MTTFTEGRYPGEAVLREASGSRSRQEITIPAGTGVVKAGTVLGELTATAGHFVPSALAEVAGNEGAEAASAVSIYEADATDVDVKIAAIKRDAEVNGSCLEFEATVVTEANKQAKADQLEAAGIIVR
jgi:hypothetical protein